MCSCSSHSDSSPSSCIFMKNVAVVLLAFPFNAAAIAQQANCGSGVFFFFLLIVEVHPLSWVPNADCVRAPFPGVCVYDCVGV